MSRRIKIPPFSDAFLFAKILIFAAVVPLLMRLKLSRLAALLEPQSSSRPVDPNRVQKICSYTEKAIRFGTPLVRPICLTRGLTRYYFLRRAGLSVSLHFGVGRVGDKKQFEGHCWLTWADEPYWEARDPRPLFVEMWRISPQPSGGPTSVGAEDLRQLTNL